MWGSKWEGRSTEHNDTKPQWPGAQGKLRKVLGAPAEEERGRRLPGLNPRNTATGWQGQLGDGVHLAPGGGTPSGPDLLRPLAIPTLSTRGQAGSSRRLGEGREASAYLAGDRQVSQVRPSSRPMTPRTSYPAAPFPSKTMGEGG